MGTKLRMSSAHHPQADGQIEAVNRVVKMALHYILHESHNYTHWDRELCIVEFAINNCPSQSTGYTLFYLNHGYHPTTSLDILRDVDTTYVENVQVFTQRM